MDHRQESILLIAFILEAIKRNAWLKLLAFGFAILLYLAAKTPSTITIEREWTLKPILVGLRTGMASPMILSEIPVRFHGTERVLADAKSMIRVEVDARKATIGRNRLQVKINIPKSLEREISYEMAPSVVILLSRSAKKRLPIQSVDPSDPAEYMSVEGATELVDKCTSIRRVAETTKGVSSEFEVLDVQGEVVEPVAVLPLPGSSKSLVLQQSKVVVTSCSFIGIPTGTAKIVDYKIVPSTVIAKAPADILAGLSRVNIRIDAEKLTKTTTIKQAFAAPPGVTFPNGTMVSVTIYVSDK